MAEEEGMIIPTWLVVAICVVWALGELIQGAIIIAAAAHVFYGWDPFPPRKEKA
jgi:hypothetical protein